jgi:arabinoxylan arabinofuranohydrolase
MIEPERKIALPAQAVTHDASRQGPLYVSICLTNVATLTTTGGKWVKRSLSLALACSVALALCATPSVARSAAPEPVILNRGNPLFRDLFTADPAPLVVGDTLYLYTGHDQAQDGVMFDMRDWLVFSTRDMKTWTRHSPIMKAKDFKWAKGDAWASQAIEKNGKFYFYAAVSHDDSHPGMAIGVAVSDSPMGPFTDARGSALIINQMTPEGTHSWEDIDPTVFTDDDGTTWIAWGNRNCYIAKLKATMTEIDGPIRKITPPHFVEGPWLHKRGNLYYLTYASLDPDTQSAERTSYATATSLDGPWAYRGELTTSAKNSFTIHPGIAEFRGQWYIFLHNATLTVGNQSGAAGRRAVTVEYLQYNPDGTLKPVVQTDVGVSVRPPPAQRPLSTQKRH